MAGTFAKKFLDGRLGCAFTLLLEYRGWLRRRATEGAVEDNAKRICCLSCSEEPILLVRPTMPPHILITNDDGIHAPGLRALAQALREIATVTIVAPSQERSAAAQSLTLRQPIYCEEIGEREYSIDGTPADAMILAFHTLLKQKPDLVISGINPGGNLGENVYYSGTVGAAMEGAINRVPAVAVSVAHRGADFDFGVGGVTHGAI